MELVADAVAVCWMPCIVSVAGVATWLSVGFAAVAGTTQVPARPAMAGTPDHGDIDPSFSNGLEGRTINVAWLFLVAWLVVAVLVALILPNRKWHYFATCLAPLVLLASYSLGMFWKLRPLGWRGFPVWLVLVWMVAEVYAPMRTHLEKLSSVYYWSTQASGPASANRTAEWIREHTRASDAIFVIGFDPEIYALAGRPSASRYAGTFWAFQSPLGGQAIADEIMRDLNRSRPRVIVAGAADLRKLVAGGDESDPAKPVFQGLEGLLLDYAQVDPALPHIWLRRDSPPDFPAGRG
jgi:hypothetical protein